MTDKNKTAKPEVAYRVELQKKIEINKSHSEGRKQALVMRTLTYGLFGKKRYQNLYLTTSLNCFQIALKIAFNIHQRVPGLSMIVRFQTSQVLEYFVKEVNGKFFEEKKYSRISIKLTRNPTKEDMKEPGYHRGLEEHIIPQDQLLDRLFNDRKVKRRNPEYREKGNRENRNNQDRRDYRQDRDRRNNKQEHNKSLAYREKDGRDEREERRPVQRYRENVGQKLNQTGEYRRGERKTRGGARATAVEYREKNRNESHSEYKEKRNENYDQRRRHDNRDEVEKETRRNVENRNNDRRPNRKGRRYDDDEN